MLREESPMTPIARHLCLSLALFPGLAMQGTAQTAPPPDSRLSAMVSRDDGRGFEAVGRLNLDGLGFCTATLISESRVLTAAHCLFDRSSGARLDDSRIEFLAGWRSGRAEAIRRVTRSAVWPAYVPAQTADISMIPSDIAVLELDRPIRTTSISPIAIGASAPATGNPVTVISYARGRSEAPSIQETCHVLEQRADRVTVLSCDIDFGSSGSPVLAADRTGGSAIVSLISARAEGTSSPLSLGMQLSDRVDALNRQLDAALGPTAPAGSQGARGSARFLRP